MRFYILTLSFVLLTSASSVTDGENTVVLAKNEFSKLQDRLSNLEKLVYEQQLEIKELKPAVKKHPGQTRQRKRSKRHSQGEVAFYSFVEQRLLLHQAGHQNIVFENAMLNLGHGYNPVNGTFTAPVYGLYLVTSSLLSERNKEIWAEVVVNDIVVARINGRGTDNRHGSGSQTVIVILQKDDKVTIQNLYADDAYWGDKYCTFAGFLITEYPDETPDIIG